MADDKGPSPDTVARAASELVGMPIDSRDLNRLAALVGSLTAEFAAMRAADVGPDEPATTYTADVQS